MSMQKIHSALSFLFFFMLLLPITSNANNPLFSKLNGDGNIAGYLNIKTPNNTPYRVYEVDIKVSMLPTKSACDGLFLPPQGVIKFAKTTKIDLVTSKIPITSDELRKMFGNYNITCMQIVTYHHDNHSGEIDSNKVQLTPNTTLLSASAPFDIDLVLH